MDISPKNKRYAILAGILLVLTAIGGGSFVSVAAQRVIVEGVDSYNTHRLIFSENTFSQVIESDWPIQGVGLLLVDIRRSGIPHTIYVAAQDIASEEVIATTTIQASQLKDDTFTPAVFTEPLPQNTPLLIQVQVPEATIDTALGWRFDPKEAGYPRFENENIQEGAFAFSLIQKIPLRLAVANWITDNAELVQRILWMTIPIILLTVLGSQIGWRKVTTPKKRIIKWLIIISIICSAIVVRLYTESYMGGVSGGDPYNYLLISQSLARFENPFEGAKRLPGYPLLLIPAATNPSIDAHTYMRTLSILFSAGTLALFYILTRQLKLPFVAGFAAVAILAFQKDFFATSLRPEPYTLYGMLLMAALVLFFSARKPWQQYLFGITLGYAAMVRQEGFVLAIIFGLFFLIETAVPWVARLGGPPRTPSSEAMASDAISRGKDTVTGPAANKARVSVWIATALKMFTPALVIVSPFFINNAIQFGNPLYTPYFKGEKLQIVDSWQAFSDASISTWSIISSMWKPSWTQLELLLPYDHPLLPAALFITLSWWLLVHHIRVPGPKKLKTALTVVLCLSFAAWLFYLGLTDRKDLARLAPIIISGIAIASPMPFFVRHGFKGILIGVIFATQVLIALWFHPFPKHYQQSYPFIALAIATALFTIPTQWSHVRRVAMVFAAFIPFTMVSYLLYWNLNIFIDSHNAHAARDSVDYRATRAALHYPGPYFYEQAGLPADIYIPRQHRLDVLAETPEEFANALSNGTANTIITSSSHNLFNPNENTWQLIETFKSEGKDEVLHTASVYTRK